MLDEDFDAHKKQTIADVQSKHTNLLRQRMSGELNGAPAKRMPSVVKNTTAVDAAPNGDGNIVFLPVSSLVPNPHQPRKHMDSIALAELADTISQYGLLQPIVVLEQPDGKYMTILGHRRTEAHKMLGLEKIKAIIAPSSDKERLIGMVLIENIQREDLNPIELALSLRGYINDGFYKNGSQIAAAIGISNTRVSRYLSALTLPDDILDEILKQNTIRDMDVIDALRKQEESFARELYDWYKKTSPSRHDFLMRIKAAEQGREAPQFTIKNSNKGCTIKLPALSEEQEKKIASFVQSLIAND